MQEDVENKSIVLIIKGAKLSGRVLRAAMRKYLAHRKEKKIERSRAAPTGKQTVKQLIGQGQGVTNIEIADGDIKPFERIARKYGVNYAVKKDMSGEVPKYLVFFKARDTDALTSAFREYAAQEVKRGKKPTLQEQMQKAQAKMKPLERTEKHKTPKAPER